PTGRLFLMLHHPARISVVGSDGRAYGPDFEPLRGDDSFDRDVQAFETHYIQDQYAEFRLPAGRASITVWYGDAHAIARTQFDVRPDTFQSLELETPALDLPADF